MDIIEGVRILTQEEVLVKAYGGIGCLLLLTVCVTVGIIYLSNFIVDIINIKKFSFPYFFMTIVAIICIIFLVKDYNKSNKYQTQYMVEISDEASFNEIYHKYKVIEDKENNIYIVCEKEESKE